MNQDKQSKKHHSIYLLFLLLSIIALTFSIIILVQKTTYNVSINNFCAALNSQSQCEAVQQSEYGKIFGIDNPWYGIFGFCIILILSIFNYLKENKIVKRVIIGASVIASSLAIYFLYLQKYVIGAYCIFCVIVDIISILMLLAAFYMTYKEYS